MDKRTPPPSTSLPHGERKNEVSKRDQHLLPKVQTSHSTCRCSLQGGQAADPIVGSQTTRKTKTRLRRAEISPNETNPPDNQKSACPTEKPHPQTYNLKARHHAQKNG